MNIQKLIRVYLAIIAAAFLGAACAEDTTRPMPQPLKLPSISEHPKLANELSKAFREAARAVQPSVVNVISVTLPEQPAVPREKEPPSLKDLPFRNQWIEGILKLCSGSGMISSIMQNQKFMNRILGTGIIFSQDGYIATHRQTIDGADDVMVKLTNGRIYSAKTIGFDQTTDLAVLKIEAPDLIPATFADSDAAEVGDWVLSIGNPRGLEQTMSAGIVSAKGKVHTGLADDIDFIQTDAAINQGNSGGPLVNLEGKVIAINMAIGTRSGGNSGIGFAAPSNMAQSILNNLINSGKGKRENIEIVGGQLKGRSSTSPQTPNGKQSQ